MTLRRLPHTLLCLIPAILLAGCFTGVESTPRITYKEVEKQKAATTDEQRLAATFRPRPLARWRPGDRFLAASPQAGKAFAGSPAIAEGTELRYLGARERVWVLGDSVAELLFATPAGDTLASNATSGLAELMARQTPPDLPFVIDLRFVEEVDRALAGRRCYLRTNLWNNPADGSYTRGRKFIPVTIETILPGNATHPLLARFAADDGLRGELLMSAGAESSRSFDSLFSFTDPRDRYPEISDARWALICDSRIENGMTRAEARLALGPTSEIDRGHSHSTAYERWTYPDGRYLIFEDGILTRHN
ncbi:MAG: DUF2845 domain-containing protein [Muribaculaceae bacterium]|nr:DUF2845 domain-containing protein [Muribaculaceae bacterium]